MYLGTVWKKRTCTSFLLKPLFALPQIGHLPKALANEMTLTEPRGEDVDGVCLDSARSAGGGAMDHHGSAAPSHSESAHDSDESGSDDSDDSDDSEGDAQLSSEASELRSRLDASPDAYTLHLRLIAILQKQADLAAVRAAREALASRLTIASR